MVAQAVYDFGVATVRNAKLAVHDVEFGIPFSAKGLACSRP
jgi:hypothetical protein